MKGKNLIFFLLLGLVAGAILVSQIASPSVEASTTGVTAENEELSVWLLQLEGDWLDVVKDPIGLTTEDGTGYIEAGSLFGEWHEQRWTYNFQGGSKLNFRNTETALYVDIFYANGDIETITLAE